MSYQSNRRNVSSFLEVDYRHLHWLHWRLIERHEECLACITVSFASPHLHTSGCWLVAKVFSSYWFARSFRNYPPPHLASYTWWRMKCSALNQKKWIPQTRMRCSQGIALYAQSTGSTLTFPWLARRNLTLPPWCKGKGQPQSLPCLKYCPHQQIGVPQLIPQQPSCQQAWPLFTYSPKHPTLCQSRILQKFPRLDSQRQMIQARQWPS